MVKSVPFYRVIVALVLLTGVARAQVPPPPNIPDDLMQDRLLQLHRRQIRQRLEWWTKSMLAAKSDAEVIHTRRELTRDYTRYLNDIYRDTVAEIAADQFMPLLTGKAYDNDDSLRKVKRINVAIALSSMGSPSIAPTLKYMVDSDNQALRYYGWKGFGEVRQSILATSSDVSKGFLESLKMALAEETNPLLYAQVLSAADLRGLTLSETRRTRLAGTILEAMQAAVPHYRKVITGGESELIDLIPQTVRIVRYSCAQGPEITKGCLQLVYDLAASSANAYDKEYRLPGRDEKRLTHLAAILRSSEAALNEMTENNQSFIAKALDSQADRGAALLEAVLFNWGDLLKPMGVTTE